MACAPARDRYCVGHARTHFEHHTQRVLRRNGKGHSPTTCGRTDHRIPDWLFSRIRAANDPAIKSPSGIFLPGKHWMLKTFKVEPPKADLCPDHEWEAAHHCRACLADLKAGDRDPNVVGKGRHKPKTTKPPPDCWRTIRTKLGRSDLASPEE